MPLTKTVTNDPTYWRNRAQELRATVENLSDEPAKKMMLEIAESYERLAERIEVRAGVKNPE